MTLKKAHLSDLHALRKICVDAYAQNFHDHWEPGGLDWYLEREFGVGRLTADLTNPNIEYYLVAELESPIGFLKLREVAFAEYELEDVAELEKIYIIPDHKGNGVGTRVMAELIDLLSLRKKRHLYLHVIDTNNAAISFYEKIGFRFQSRTRLDIPYFKEELKGMLKMRLDLR